MAREIKRGDTVPSLVATLKATPAGKRRPEPVDLTLATTVTFLMAQVGGEKRVSGECTVATPQADLDLMGQVVYEWQSGDTDVAGTYYAEFEVEWPGGFQTFPSDSYAELIVRGDLGTAAPSTP